MTGTCGKLRKALGYLTILLATMAPRHAEAQNPRLRSTDEEANLLTQLENCREGLRDPQARPNERQRWAELLFTLDAPQARSLVVELLTDSGEPAVQRALCEAIVDRTYRERRHLQAELVEPLISLLAVDGDDLRKAASRALAGCERTDVALRLSALAADVNAPRFARLAAIEVLASQIDRREVVRELISLLGSDDSEIVERITSVLAQLSRVNHGNDVGGWRDWWTEQSLLTEEAWLADRLRMYRDRWRLAERDWAGSREEDKRRLEALSVRISIFQTEAFRFLTADQQDGKLMEWLDDPLNEVKTTALAIIQARIADEGQRPSEEVRSALLRLLKEGTPPVRREVLLIVQTLQDPPVIKAVLAQIELEKDPANRLAILKAVGKLNSLEFVPALLGEIASPQSDVSCVREAALALEEVAPKLEDPQNKQQAIQTLHERYSRVATGDSVLRPALLSAMAGIGDSSFSGAFAEAVESDDPAVVRPAIQGLRAIRDTSKLARLRTLLGDTHPLVRRSAAEAFGILGTEDADLEALLARLNPAIESSESVRDAAWKSFRELLGGKSAEERYAAAQRLRDTPELELRYLDELAYGLAESGASADLLPKISDRIAQLLTVLERHEDTSTRWRRLYELKSRRGDGDAQEIGLRWLDAALNADREAEVAGVIGHLLEDKNHDPNDLYPRIVDRVVQRLGSAEWGNDPERVTRFLAALRIASPVAGEDSWLRLMDQVEIRLNGERRSP